MNEEDSYLNSEKLEQFCLGLLPEEESRAIVLAIEKYPNVKKRVEAIEQGLITAYEMQPAKNLKLKIFERLDKIPTDEAIDLKNLPSIHKHSNAGNWNKAVQSILPPQDQGELKMIPLLQNNSTEMFVAWLHISLEEDGHDPEEDFIESFLILEGSCECNVGGKIFYLQAGDYIEIPPRTKHTIQPTSVSLGYVKAIVQRIKAA
jgi:mannose-6-phosphate isomerase-like protein (cupin superfamily)